jgi:predicted metal-dependent phosphotriesterase family hydrolase
MNRYSRRKFLKEGITLTAGYSLPIGNLSVRATKLDRLMTVKGPIIPDKVGFTLSHEHIMVDFIGATKVSKSRYNQEDVYNKALTVLLEAKSKGINTIMECTPAYLGRDVVLLRKLSEASGLNLITNTGYYGAAKEKYIPPHAYNESSRQVANRWIDEWKNGIEGSGIRPGFIKSGVDNYPLSPVQQKLVEAAALTHLETGLTIGIHTGDGKAALEEMKIITAMGADPSSWIWIHAQNEADRTYHLKVAENGGWVSFDGYNKERTTDYVRFLNDMKQAKRLSQVLISHDAGWYHVGEPGGGNYRSYDEIPDFLVPAMKANGFTENDLNLVFSTNPATAFSVSRRALKAK